MTIKLVGNFDTSTLCDVLRAHFGSQEGWCLSEEDTMAGRAVVFTPQKRDLDISGVQAIMDAHGAIDWKLKKAHAEANKATVASLLEIDIASIRSLREYFSALPDAPAVLKNHEAAAKAARALLV